MKSGGAESVFALPHDPISRRFLDHRTQHNAQRNGKLHHGIEPAEIAFPVRFFFLILLLAATFPACSRETDLSRRTDDYEIVQEGSAPGVTTTLIPPGDSPVMLPSQTSDPSITPPEASVAGTELNDPGNSSPFDPGFSQPVTKSASAPPEGPSPAGTTTTSTTTAPPATTAFPPPLSTQPPSTTRTPPPSQNEEPPEEEQEEEPAGEEDPPNPTPRQIAVAAFPF